MAIVSGADISEILLVGLRMSPAEREAAQQKWDAASAGAAAKERSYYASLSPAGQAEYDALTFGMLPRVPRG